MVNQSSLTPLILIFYFLSVEYALRWLVSRSHDNTIYVLDHFSGVLKVMDYI